MASIRFTDVQARLTEFLDLTSLTLEEFQQLGDVSHLLIPVRVGVRTRNGS
jgi:hypothetical protein